MRVRYVSGLGVCKCWKQCSECGGRCPVTCTIVTVLCPLFVLSICRVCEGLDLYSFSSRSLLYDYCGVWIVGARCGQNVHKQFTSMC